MLLNKIYDRINHLNPFSPESKQMIRDVGNIELCELLETESKTQCHSMFIIAWSVGIVYCTCEHFLREGRGENQKFIKYTMGSSFNSGVRHQERTTSRTPMWKKSRETGNTFRPTSFRRSARRSYSRASMIDSYEMKHSVIEWFKMVETKMFVDIGMFWQMRIIPTIWLHKKNTITRVIGGVLQTRQVPIPCQWKHRPDFKQALSTLQRLQQEAGEEPQVACLLSQTPTMGGTQFIFYMVELARVHGGLLINPKVKTEMHQVIEWTGRPVACSIWKDSSEKNFHEFN